MKISVVIPAYNEEVSLPLTLDSLSRQETQYDFEVIIVDNNSTDNTAKVANSYLSKINLGVIKEPKKGRGAARRAGFRSASGDIIASTDADTIVPTNWIESIGDSFTENPSIVAITALCRYPSKKISIRLFNHILLILFKLFRLLIGNYWLSGYSFAIKRDVYFEAGEFHVDIDAQEDSELSLRVAKLGIIKYVPGITVTSSDRRFNNGLLRGLVPYVKTFYQMKNNNFKATLLDDQR